MSAENKPELLVAQPGSTYARLQLPYENNTAVGVERFLLIYFIIIQNLSVCMLHYKT